MRLVTYWETGQRGCGISVKPQLDKVWSNRVLTQLSKAGPALGRGSVPFDLNYSMLLLRHTLIMQGFHLAACSLGAALREPSFLFVEK